MQRLLLLPALLIALVAALACDEKPKGDPGLSNRPAPITDNPNRGLLLVRGSSLLIRDMQSGVESEIRRAPSAEISYYYPRWSPDGTRIAYVINTQYTGGPGQNWGGDIMLSEPNGSNERALFTRPVPGISIEGIAWSADGGTLYVGFLTTRLENNRFIDQTFTIERLDVATGTRTVVIEDALQPALSRDGKRLAYISYDTDAGQGGLWTATVDGSDRRLLVPTDDRFALVVQPHWSPDGTRLAFAAVSLGSSATPDSERRGGRAAWRWPWQPSPAAAHGLPQDIWTVPAAGGSPEKLTFLLADEPSPAWSPDGTQIAMIATGGLYLIPSAGGPERKIGLGATTAQLDWR